jgi:glucose/arabinose dehydrogenase
MAPARRSLSLARWGAIAIVSTIAIVGCSTVSPAPPTAGAPATAPARSGASGVPASLPAASATAFDPSRIAITAQPFATVPGGPLAIAAPHDGSGRLFVASQDGRAWVVDRGTTGSTPLLDITGLVTSGGERGLLGLAIHPSFPSDPRVFVDYTDRNGDTVVASYRIEPGDANRLDPTSAVVVLQVGQPFPNHNGGALAFGPDGDLYVSLGDGGSEGDPQGNGQKLDTTLGKIIRIDVDHPTAGRQYAIPAGNPFTGNPLARPEIWLSGLRNPWRMSFDRATGDLWIGDVGQNAWEEVDVARAGVGGSNFGWNTMEGDHCYQPAQGCDQTGLTLPVAEYGHDAGCVVIGGVVYRGSRYPILQGGYLYLDYCSGTVWALDASAPAPKPGQVGRLGANAVAVGEDEGGELYVANLDGTLSALIAGAR